MAKCRPIYRGGRQHRTDMSVVVPITFSCRPRVLPGHKVTWNTSTTDIGAGTDTNFIGACTPALRCAMTYQLSYLMVWFSTTMQWRSRKCDITRRPQSNDSEANWFYGEFAILRKGTISFVESVCPSVRHSLRMEKLGSQWTNFYEIWYLSIFRESVEKIQVSLKSDKNIRYFTWRQIYIFDNISLISN